MIFLKLVILFYFFILPKLINSLQVLSQGNKNMEPILRTLPPGSSPLLFQREQIPYFQRRRNILNNDKEDESNRRPWKDNARDIGKEKSNNKNGVKKNGPTPLKGNV